MLAEAELSFKQAALRCLPPPPSPPYPLWGGRSLPSGDPQDAPMHIFPLRDALGGAPASRACGACVHR